MKRVIYIITMIYYLVGIVDWIMIYNSYFMFLPIEFDIGYGLFSVNVLQAVGDNVIIAEACIIYILLIVFTSVAHFLNKKFNVISLIVLIVLLALNLFSLIISYITLTGLIAVLINVVLIIFTIYISKTAKMPVTSQGE